MYREGSGATSLGKALGNYNVNLSFLKDNVETSKFAFFRFAYIIIYILII